MSIDHVLGSLEQVRTVGDDQWTARCPAHKDSTPSLSIAIGEDGRVLIHCHAGCSVEQITAAANLALRDLAPGGGPRDRSAIVATYDYVDETGRLVFQKMRFSPKRFAQRRPDPGAPKGWVWNLTGVRDDLLYRLPAVLEAVEHDDEVWIPEGEKDCDALVKAGVCATTNPGGAGKWRSEMTRYLAGARVIIVADRDEQGRRHAADIAANLAGAAQNIRVVEAAAGKDAADHFAAGHSLNDFHVVEPNSGNLNGTTKQGAERLRLRPLSTIRRRKPTLLLPGLEAPVGTIGILCGQQGVGKGTVLARWAAEVTRQGHGVIVIAEEDSASAVAKPRAEAAGADISRVYTVDGVRPDEFGGIMLPRDTNELQQLAQDADARLIVIDPWTNHVGFADIDKGAIRGALMPLRYLAEAVDACVVLAAHPVKNAGRGHPMDEIAHASAVSQVARWAYWVTLDPEHGPNPRENPHRLVAHVKANLTKWGETLRYSMAEVVLPADEEQPEVAIVKATPDGTSVLDYTRIRELERATSEQSGEQSQVAACRRWLVEFLGTGPQESGAVKHAGDELGFSESTVGRAAAKEGVVKRRRRAGTPSVWSLPANPQPPVESRQPVTSRQDSDLTDLTDLTIDKSPQSGQSHTYPREADPTVRPNRAPGLNNALEVACAHFEATNVALAKAVEIGTAHPDEPAGYEETGGRLLELVEQGIDVDETVEALAEIRRGVEGRSV